MFRLSFHLAVVLLVACASATAGEIPLYRGQSNKYAIEFPHPTDLPNSMIEISAYVEGDLAYTKTLTPVPFRPECRLTTNELSCSKNGKSPLAGATYKRTRDGTPQCPGQAEDRFTCVSGCSSAVPRYITFSQSEC